MNPMSPIIVLVRKDLKHFLRDRASLAITFLIPFGLIALMGFIFGLYGSHHGPNGIDLAVVDLSGSAGGAQLVAALKAEPAFHVITDKPGPNGSRLPLAEGDLDGMIRSDRFHFALVLPKDFTSGSGIGLRVKLVENPQNNIETQMVTGLLQKTLFMSVPRLIGSHLQALAGQELGSKRLEQFDRRMAQAVSSAFGVDEEAVYGRIRSGDMGWTQGAAGDGAGGSNFLSRILTIDTVKVAGKEMSDRAATATGLVGGWAIQFLLFAVAGSAVSLFYEQAHGLFQRLLAGACPRSAILYSKFIYGMLIGLLQLMVLFIAGHFLFGVAVGPYLPQLVLVCLCAAAVCSAFGMLLASVAGSQDAARGLSTFVILGMSAIGGAWMPISLYPAIVQRFSRLTPVYWSMQGFSKVLWLHASYAELMVPIGVLLGMTALILAIACWRLNRSTMFN